MGGVAQQGEPAEAPTLQRIAVEHGVFEDFLGRFDHAGDVEEVESQPGEGRHHVLEPAAACPVLANRFGPLPVLLQLPVLACWLLVRPISIAAFAGCCAFAPIKSSRAPSA